MNNRVLALTGIVAATLVATSCRHVPSARPAPSAKPAPNATSARPAPSAKPAPSAPDVAACRALWSRYHAEEPADPYVTPGTFVARCTRSAPAVLTCLQSARKKVQDLILHDAPNAGPAVLARIRGSGELLMSMDICTTRERLRFALHSGELAAIARDVVAGKLHPDKNGIVVLSGERATLPARGVVERTNYTENAAPPGEIRVARQTDGNVWLYFLGVLLGRHQNQIGFVYSSKPVTALDHDSAGNPAVCFPVEPAPTNPGGNSHRYLLSCFTVMQHIAPQLLKVGAAPD